MSNRRLGILFLVLLAVSIRACAEDVGNALNQFRGKTLVLRHPLKNDSQQYGSDGKVFSAAAEGPWTVYGGVLIDKATLKPDRLRIEGLRVLFLFLKGQFTVMEFQILKDRKKPPFQPEVKLEVLLDHPLADSVEAGAVMNRLFAMNTAE